MSYNDTHCPCGDKKQPGEMLCDACVQAFQNTHELEAYQNKSLSQQYRRGQAIRLLTAARARKRSDKHPSLTYKDGEQQPALPLRRAY